MQTKKVVALINETLQRTPIAFRLKKAGDIASDRLASPSTAIKKIKARSSKPH
jgi:uncharacterized protein (DUF4213/DUF364 family)